MPKLPCKDLYIAKSMSDLNDKCLYDFDKSKSIKSHLQLVNKAFQAADKANSEHDEERAYILYMRYLDATTKIRKSKEFKQQADHYNVLFGSSKAQTALENAEKLSVNLKKRYDKIKALNTLKEKEETPLPKNNSSGIEDVDAPAPYIYPQGSLSSQKLYELLIKEKKSLLLMDIRSSEEFEDSHIIHQSSINVPNNCIKPGTIPSKIESGMPLNYVKMWNTRDEVDLVVLIDWYSSLKRLEDKGDPLRSLKDSIFKWEQVKELKREPVILDGGYADWLESFPQFTSNPSVKPPDNKPKTGKLNSLLEFSYSDLKRTFNGTAEEKSSTENGISNAITSSDQHVADVQKPDVQKPELPVVNSSEREPLAKTIPAPSSHQSDLVVPALYPTIDTNLNLSKISQKTTYVKEEEQAKSIKAQPTFDRSIKPKQSKDISNPPTSVNITSGKETFSSTTTTKKKDNPPLIVDRSTKPTNNRNKFATQPQVLNDASHKPPANTESDEADMLQQNILRLQKEKEEREKNIREIEEKKKIAHLRSIQQQMERDIYESEKREIEAEKELATAMRGIKPTDIKNTSSKESNQSNQEIIQGEEPHKTLPTSLHQQSKKTDSVSTDSKHISQSNSNLAKTATYKYDANEENAKVISTTPPSSQLVKDKAIPEVAENNLAREKNDHAIVNNTITPIISSENNKAATSKTIKAGEVFHKPQTGDKETSNKHEHPNVPPPVYASVKKTSDINLVDSKSIPNPHTSKVSKSTSNSVKEGSIYQAPLKDEPDSKSSGLKRSFSSPNIAKMVQNEIDLTNKPAIPNRQVKPKLPTQQNQVQIPNRDAKPNYVDPQDHSLSALHFSLRGVYGGEGRAMCGLRNLGNSCYMNSVLQCMFNTTQLAEYILTNSYRSDINKNNVLGHAGKVAECFSVLLRAVWSGQYRYLIPSDMKQIAGSINPIFAGYTQEDSHEFLMLLLDGLHEDLNRITKFKYKEEPDTNHMKDEDAAIEAWNYHKKRNESIIVELFTGQFKATVQCLTCGKSSRKFDAFQFLSLSLPSKSASIYDLIRDFGKREKMTGDDMWKCPQCKVLREAIRTIQIWKLPPLLIIHLKRFVHTGRWRDKIHTTISFPPDGLELNSFTCKSTNMPKRPSYSLYAVSHHHGAGLDSGHYTASCRSVVDKHWYKFDDTEVSRSTFPQDSSAFILFYSCYARQVPRHNSFQSD